MRYTLVADGASDRVLIPILTWALRRVNVSPVIEQWADFSRIPRQNSLGERLRAAIELYPCDVLFVHRDAEGQPPELRRAEIANAAGQIRHVPVVPVRMTETWLLADEQAIRHAAGNPNGADELNLPEIRRLEDLAEPKRTLHGALEAASGLNARRRSRFRVRECVQLIPNYMDDFSCLNALTAFADLQQQIRVLAGVI